MASYDSVVKVIDKKGNATLFLGYNTTYDNGFYPDFYELINHPEYLDDIESLSDNIPDLVKCENPETIEEDEINMVVDFQTKTIKVDYHCEFYKDAEELKDGSGAFLEQIDGVWYINYKCDEDDDDDREEVYDLTSLGADLVTKENYTFEEFNSLCEKILPIVQDEIATCCFVKGGIVRFNLG